MSCSDGQIEQDILVLNRQLALNPRANGILRVVLGLRYVLSSRPYPHRSVLAILDIPADPDRVLQEPSALRSPPIQLGHHRRRAAFDADGVPDVLARAIMLPCGVDDTPPALLLKVVRAAGFVLDDDVLGVERVAGEVVFGSSCCVDGEDVGLDEAVVHAVDHGVDAYAEHVLMVLGVDIGGYSGTEGIGLVILGDINGEDSSQADLEFDASILIEVVIPDVFWVICSA